MALAQSRSRVLDVRLFGEPRFIADGVPARITMPPKALLLLCVLALKAGQPVDRTKLAFTLWPDEPEDEAKGKLRRHLHLLGRAIASTDDKPQIAATNTTLTLNVAASCTVDVVEFERLSRSPEDLESAAALYSGDLLANFYEDWLEAPRRRLRELQLQNLLALAERAIQLEDPAKALEHARAALRIDPWREDAIRHVVLARTQLGDRSGAMQEYAHFVSRLREEFGAEPLSETKQAFEAAKIVEPPKTNLPLETTSFIGRQAQLYALNDLLQTSRMVTVTGPGGVGKSRTAIYCARELVPSYSDGVWLIEAGTGSSEEHLLHAIAETLGLDDMPQAVSLHALTQRLRDRRVLLVFDNVETFVDPCGHVCESILTSCQHISILATSREPLAITSEQVMRLAPFDDDADAVALFYDRAHAADVSFAQTQQNRDVVAEICRRMDRLPLATELAAARVATLSPEEILERLHDRFALLKRARAPAVRHHQTLRATIAWSHDLLSQEEKTLFRRLAIFAGAFTLAAIEAVCADEAFSRAAILDTVARLVDKSLVSPILSGQTRRYRFLDSIREYALCEIYESADVPELRERYLAYYASLASRSAKELSGPRQQSFLQMLQEELDNLRAALQFGEVDASHAAACLAIACELQQFWLVRGYFAEGRRWIGKTLEAADEYIGQGTRARALSSAALLASFSDDRSAAQQLEQQAVELRGQIGDEDGVAQSVHSLGCYAFDVGDFDRAQAFFMDALERARRIGAQTLIAKALDNVGLCAVALGDFEAARKSLEESLVLYRAQEDAYGTSWVLAHLGWLFERMHKYDTSLALHEESLKIREQLNDRHGIACSSLAMARCFDALGHRETARAARRRSITIWRELRYTIWFTEAFENYAYAESTGGDARRAATFLGAAEKLRSVSGKSLPVYERAEHDAALAHLERGLGADQLARCMQAGSSMQIDELLNFALTD